jgi:predicted nucleic acid-binding protein
MSIDRVVVNASPLICLFKSGLQDLLPALFREISVPEAVLSEVTDSGKNDFPAKHLAKQPCLKTETKIPLDLRVAAWDLGRCESEVISFALLNPSHRLVLDDRGARRCAETLGCKCIGTAEILVLARRRNLLPSLRDLSSAILPQTHPTVVPEAVLIGNPTSNSLKSWFPDKVIRG